MPNDYFRFKEFTVRQDRCAMRVCTDSCVFGAYAASEIARLDIGPDTILDIGGGTGLLSLMLAQKTTARIDAVEIHEPCSQQMKNNFENAPWRERLRAIHADIRQWHPSGRYDLIISNPPFFENDLKGTNAGKTLAMHDSGLKLDDLIQLIHIHLTPEGNFCVMVPAKRKSSFEKIVAGNSGTITAELTLKHRAGKEPFRYICFGNFQQFATEKRTEELVIEDSKTYTENFKDLLRDYYLFL